MSPELRRRDKLLNLFACFFLLLILTCPIQVTLGEEGSWLSKLPPFFFPVAGKVAGEAAPLMLRLVLSLRLSEVVSEKGGSRVLVLPGLNIDLDEMEWWWREVKQMNKSLVVTVRCGGGRSESIDWFVVVIITWT